MRLVCTAAILHTATAVCGGLPEKLACGACLDIVGGQPCERYNTCDCMGPTHIVGGCVAAGFCKSVTGGGGISEGFGLRVSKAHGKRDYGLVRVSVVTQTPASPEPGFFDYSSQFRYRWTDNYLHSALKRVVPGQVNTFKIGGQQVSVQIPQAGAGAAGVMIADPCFLSSQFLSPVTCQYGDQFKTATRTPLLLNAFVGSGDTDFWSVLGDNFYDREGNHSKEFFAKLDNEVKHTPLVTVPGNHDYWVLGTPEHGTGLDQCANGFMQFYGQDSEAALIAGIGNGAAPFNFSVDPSSSTTGCARASPDNTRFVHQIGNIGIIGQSGAYTLEDYNLFMKDSCQWLATTKGVEVGVLVGHWDVGGMGAGDNMDVPDFYAELKKLPGCKEMAAAGNLKFFMGHTHCNVPHPHGYNDTGFMVAGQGMGGCANYGIPIIDTTEGRNRVYYFDASTDAAFDAVSSCVTSNGGWRGCLSLAETWLDEPRTATMVV